MRILTTIAVVVCILFSVGCNNEKSDYDAGIEAYKRGHYAVALSNFESRVMKDEDDFVAQFCLGYMYKQGKGVRANNEKAIEYYEKSAEQDYAPAMNNLAIMYLQRVQDAKTRLTDREDISRIEEMQSNSDMSNKWFGKAILEENNRVAQYNFARARYVQAVTFEVFAERKDEFLESHLKRPKENQDQEWIEFWMSTPDRAEEEYKQAVIWFRESAKNNYPQAWYQLADRYYNGEGVEKNLTEAVKWYRKAAHQGNADAQNALGAMYYHGKGVEKNLTEAVKWFEKAANRGNAYAQLNLGMRYHDGEGVEKNLTEAVKWYRKAAHRGNAEAQNNLAIMYKKGEGMPKSNPEMAARWFLQAAQLGNRKAQRNLGTLFETGLKDKNGDEQIPKDKKEAYYWYSLVLRSDAANLDGENPTNSFPNVRDWRESIRKQLTEPEIYEIQKRIDDWKPRILYSVGTGFYIDENHILTNAHVVTEDNDMKHECDEFRIPYRHVKLIEKDRDVDLALLRDTDENIDRAIFRSNPVDIGEDIVSFGYPLSFRLSYRGNGTLGIISGLSGTINDSPYYRDKPFLPDNFFQHTAPIQGGNSGGPMFDGGGNVVGVTVSGLDPYLKREDGRVIIEDRENINFAIKFDVIQAFIKNLKKDDIPVNITVSDPAPKDIEDLDETKRQKIYAKARKFTVPVLCFKNKEPESLSMVEIGIGDLE
ncbi:MAG: tetratricopeptide repeat-containing serine protease family protein [Candidatus Poribacteria bacterium]|nr:tetratricopeptide repeat-containing serine protease family protein [Candidatus Poribacteria bacterium]MDE0467522.1 tetratricopeptide repeat-containing serine protease family protein [Candidatus Poribacteria bacterium]